MKNSFKKKIFIVPLIVVIAVLAFGGAVYAAYALTLPGQFNIVTATNDIKVYSDPNCLFELKEIIWDDLPVGGESEKTIYIRNLGNTDTEVVATLNDAPTGVSLKVDSNSVEIMAGSHCAFILYLEATTTTIAKPASVAITFTNSPIYLNP